MYWIRGTCGWEGPEFAEGCGEGWCIANIDHAVGE